ncbi:hypothetical protein FNV43_RR24123 [Rhamnella rubrinervis]|uniref:DUF4005 domain-containing protein n=1 Tax=Rhamnella rubrinervis TaxID=2594499 RepID=A0A8K0DQJ5_9ROSA|nr:hypothetical protein FNV43_RR24123 [Rhamnella rubrinervis]
MGFFRRLFGPKKPASSPQLSKDKRRWSFVKDKSHNTTSLNTSTSTSDTPASSLDANKHAIAVAAATAAVAEAALAAAHAAAEVVRLTNGTGSVSSATTAHASRNRNLAAVKIQSAFRAYLARRALRALKALVKLQALVRGHIVRKQTADMLRRMHTLVRVQTRARASRTHISELLHSSSMSSSLPNHPVPESPDKNAYQHRAYSNKFDGPSILKRCGSISNYRNVMNLDKARLESNWLDRWMEESVRNNCQGTSLRYSHADDEKTDKILEVDTWKPHLDSQRSTRSFQVPRHVLASDYYNQSFMDSPSKRATKASNLIPNLPSSSMDISSLSSFKCPIGKDEAALRTADNSPQVFSASSRPGSARKGPFTPARSECSWGVFSAYSGYPNYMANTESSRAKVRSQSAPRQRLEFEKYASTKKSVQGLWDASIYLDKSLVQDADSRNYTYSSSSHFNRLGNANLR